MFYNFKVGFEREKNSVGATCGKKACIDAVIKFKINALLGDKLFIHAPRLRTVRDPVGVMRLE